MIHGHIIERIWTTIPVLILLIITVPCLILLYRLDELDSSSLRIKVIGHQWFWKYEITDFWINNESIEFDCYIVPSNELGEGIVRLLDTDNRPSLPYLTQIRVLVSRSDVLHSWAVPSLGIKIDAIPGRLNQVKLLSYKPGLVYGQCSEICGANHSFIPIVLEFIRAEDFLAWLSIYE